MKKNLNIMMLLLFLAGHYSLAEAQQRSTSSSLGTSYSRVIGSNDKTTESLYFEYSIDDNKSEYVMIHHKFTGADALSLQNRSAVVLVTAYKSGWICHSVITPTYGQDKLCSTKELDNLVGLLSSPSSSQFTTSDSLKGYENSMKVLKKLEKLDLKSAHEVIVN